MQEFQKMAESFLSKRIRQSYYLLLVQVLQEKKKVVFLFLYLEYKVLPTKDVETYRYIVQDVGHNHVKNLANFGPKCRNTAHFVFSIEKQKKEKT